MPITKESVTFTGSYHRGNNCHFHLFTVNQKISEDDAIRLQIDLGYHPAGYGMYNFSATEHSTSWECYYNCD